MSSPLPNYLLAHRKRLSLSQKEVAFLLGAESGAKTCRYERFAREPSLRTALAYEAIFHKPVRELFAGLYQTMEGEVAGRAKTLARQASDQKVNGPITSKQATLAALANHQSKHHSS